MARLALTGAVDVVITEDSDLLAYGCPVVFFKMDRAGDGEEVALADLPRCRELALAGFTHDLFVEMCVMAGCDFAASLPGVGVKKAHAAVRRARCFARAARALKFDGVPVPPGYEAAAQRAVWTFRHQRVYCAASRAAVHLRPLPPGGLAAGGCAVPGAAALLDGEPDFLGPPLEPAVARGVAEGRLNPVTRQPWALDAPPAAPAAGGGGGAAAGEGGGAAAAAAAPSAADAVPLHARQQFKRPRPAGAGDAGAADAAKRPAGGLVGLVGRLKAQLGGLARPEGEAGPRRAASAPSRDGSQGSAPGSQQQQQQQREEPAEEPADGDGDRLLEPVREPGALEDLPSFSSLRDAALDGGGDSSGLPSLRDEWGWPSRPGSQGGPAAGGGALAGVQPAWGGFAFDAQPPQQQQEGLGDAHPVQQPRLPQGVTPGFYAAGTPRSAAAPSEPRLGGRRLEGALLGLPGDSSLTPAAERRARDEPRERQLLELRRSLQAAAAAAAAEPPPRGGEAPAARRPMASGARAGGDGGAPNLIYCTPEPGADPMADLSHLPACAREAKAAIDEAVRSAKAAAAAEAGGPSPEAAAPAAAHARARAQRQEAAVRRPFAPPARAGGGGGGGAKENAPRRRAKRADGGAGGAPVGGGLFSRFALSPKK